MTLRRTLPYIETSKQKRKWWIIINEVSFRAAMRNAVSFVKVNVTSEPYEVSLLWFLWYLASAGGPLRINATSNGGQVNSIVILLLAARSGSTPPVMVDR